MQLLAEFKKNSIHEVQSHLNFRKYLDMCGWGPRLFSFLKHNFPFLLLKLLRYLITSELYSINGSVFFFCSQLPL